MLALTSPCPQLGTFATTFDPLHPKSQVLQGISSLTTGPKISRSGALDDVVRASNVQPTTLSFVATPSFVVRTQAPPHSSPIRNLSPLQTLSQ